MNSIRTAIRERPDRRRVGWPVEWVVADLNPVLRGWCVLPARELGPKVRPHRQLRPSSVGHLGQHQRRALRDQLAAASTATG